MDTRKPMVDSPGQAELNLRRTLLCWKTFKMMAERAKRVNEEQPLLPSSLQD
jgi:hypothetical protein